MIKRVVSSLSVIFPLVFIAPLAFSHTQTENGNNEGCHKYDESSSFHCHSKDGEVKLMPYSGTAATSTDYDFNLLDLTSWRYKEGAAWFKQHPVLDYDDFSYRFTKSKLFNAYYSVNKNDRVSLTVFFDDDSGKFSSLSLHYQSNYQLPHWKSTNVWKKDNKRGAKILSDLLDRKIRSDFQAAPEVFKASGAGDQTTSYLGQLYLYRISYGLTIKKKTVVTFYILPKTDPPDPSKSAS